MRKKDIEDRLVKLESFAKILSEDLDKVRLDDVPRLQGGKTEIQQLRNLLDEVIEPGYVLRKTGGSTRDWFRRSYFDVLGLRAYEPPKPVTYEIRTRISNKLIATFTTREDADAFIETLCEVVVDETGEETSE